MMNSRCTAGATMPAKAAPAQAAVCAAAKPDLAADCNDETDEVGFLAAGIVLFFALLAVVLANAAVPGPVVQSRYDAARGKNLYAANCSSCHRADGGGVPGAFPPLKGSAVVNKDDATKQIHVVFDGLQGARVGGVVYESRMPPFGDTLSDAEIADIVDYVRISWGNHGKLVTAAQVAAERANAR